MRKSIVVTVSTALGAGIGILGDYFDAKQMIVDAFPYLRAFLPVIALGLVGAAIGWMLFLVGQYIYAKCPHNRFSALHDEISQELERTETYLSFPMFAHEGSRWAKRQSLAIKLNALKVSHSSQS